MTIPTDLGGVVVADDFFVRTGGNNSSTALAPLGGTVTFSSSDVVTHIGDGPTILGEDIPATVDPATGHLEQFLLISDVDYNEPISYTVTYNLTDPSNRGRPIKRQPDSFTLTIDPSQAGQTIRLRTGLTYGQAFLTRVDNGDGTESLTGAGVSDNGDGTFTFSGPTVVDNGDGTYTYQAG